MTTVVIVIKCAISISVIFLFFKSFSHFIYYFIGNCLISMSIWINILFSRTEIFIILKIFIYIYINYIFIIFIYIV